MSDIKEWANTVSRCCETVGKWLHVQRTSEFMPLSVLGANGVRGVLRSCNAMVEIEVDIKLMTEWLDYHDAYVGDGVADL